MSSHNEWTILEKLLLTQAVYKYGENMWFQVARAIKQHDLVQLQGIERAPDFYSQKNCSYQYYVLVENLQAESQALRHDIKNDMPVVVRLARHLYSQRVEEVKSKLAQEQQEFNQLATEIHAIQSGEWDARLKPDPAYEPVKSAESSGIDRQPSVTEQLQQDDSGTKENRPATVTEEKDASMNSTLVLQENRLKRTSSDAIAHEPHPLKRSRLNDSNQEDQVLSTAVSQVPIDVQEAVEQAKAIDAEQVTMTIAGSQEDADVVDHNPKSAQEHTSQEAGALSPHRYHHAPLPNIKIPEESSPSPISPVSKSISTTALIQTPEDDYLTGDSEANTLTTSSKRNSEQRQKAWQKNINLLWQEIANHKNGTMFMNPIKKSWAPMYDQVVKQPLYLKTIKNRVRDGIVKTTTEFERDVVLMLTNSLMYNKEGTEMYLMAQEMLEDVREQLRLFKSADSFSASFWESEQVGSRFERVNAIP
ncbi:uncharacterized protein ATC70_011865 [Mucor velutinosus]|uniref:Bromo domain-containing protein n=1 Tax=Mucor velutinosus TaxID=708070 RepID=A0AAN7DAI3_9FUNG|nr:hypothetical protein ATC70_011865 [Mucor velutinosus]